MMVLLIGGGSKVEPKVVLTESLCWPHTLHTDTHRGWIWKPFSCSVSIRVIPLRNKCVWLRAEEPDLSKSHLGGEGLASCCCKTVCVTLHSHILRQSSRPSSPSHEAVALRLRWAEHVIYILCKDSCFLRQEEFGQCTILNMLWHPQENGYTNRIH